MRPPSTAPASWRWECPRRWLRTPPSFVKIHFEKGVPTAIDGEKMDSVALIEKLNALGGANGIGILDLVENRLVGMKSRGVYETPGGAILYAAHEKLEEITLDRDTQHYKQQMALRFGELGVQRPVVHPPAQGHERLRDLHPGGR